MSTINTSYAAMQYTMNATQQSNKQTKQQGSSTEQSDRGCRTEDTVKGCTGST